MSPPVGIMQKTIFHLKKHSVCKLIWNVKSMLWQLQPIIMQQSGRTWIPNRQKQTDTGWYFCAQRGKLHRTSVTPQASIFMTMNLLQFQAPTEKSKVKELMLHLWDTFGRLVGISTSVKFDTGLIKSVEHQNIQYHTYTVTPLHASKACPKIQEDSYWSNPSMNWELITGHTSECTFKSSYFEALCSYLSGGILFHARAS